MRRRVPLVLALCLAPLGPARAHQPGLSQAELRVEPGRVRARLVFARGEIAGLVPGVDADRDGRLAEIELLSVETALSEQVLRGIQIAAGREPCTGGVAGIAFVEEDGLSVDIDFACPPRPDGAAPPELTLRLSLLARLQPGHRLVGQLVFADMSPGSAGSASAPLDFVAHRRRAALTIRRPDAGAPTREPPPPGAEPSAAPPEPPLVPGWPWLLLPAALVAALVLARRRR